MSTANSDYIPLSSINQYSYCPRRCGLIHLETEFAENRHTIAGTRRHEGVDQPCHRMTEGVRLEMAMPVWSHRLRISGKCDVVEFHNDGSVIPVEYKLGKRHRWVNDDLQVAAQAICLEEMLGLKVEEGAVYHHKSRRLRAVPMTPSLRGEVEETLAAIHTMLDLGTALPEPTDKTERCRECSLQEICQPDLWRGAIGNILGFRSAGWST